MQLFPPQLEVIEKGYLDRNEHLFLNMATGSGKTYLAEIAMEKVVSSGFKALYITPLRAIAEQQYSMWKERFPGIKVGLFTGDTVNKSSTRGSYDTTQMRRNI